MNDVRNNPLKYFYFQFYCYFMNYQFIPAELLFRFLLFIPVSLYHSVFTQENINRSNLQILMSVSTR